MEKRIKIEFPPYAFYEEDFKLAETIKGLKKIGHVNPKPFGPYFYYQVDKATTEENINDFLNSLPTEFSFQFSKRLDPLTGISDTSTIVHRQGDKYFYYFFSHGQSKVWHSATRTEIFKLLVANKEFQYQQSFRTFRSTHSPVEGESAI